MALKQFLPGSVTVVHYATSTQIWRGDVIVQPEAIFIEMPNDASHKERMEFLDKAAIIKHGWPPVVLEAPPTG